MTDAEVAAQFDVVWNGGELLPPYESNVSLTEATRAKPTAASVLPASRTPTHYSADLRVTVRQMAALKIPDNVIAKHVRIPQASVHSMVHRWKQLQRQLGRAVGRESSPASPRRAGRRPGESTLTCARPLITLMEAGQ